VAPSLLESIQAHRYAGSCLPRLAFSGARVGAGFITDSRLFDRFGTGLDFTQLITDPGRTKNLVASSRLEAQAGAQNAQATRYDVLLQVNRLTSTFSTRRP
jgi:outer membrane protein